MPPNKGNTGNAHTIIDGLIEQNDFTFPEPPWMYEQGLSAPGFEFLAIPQIGAAVTSTLYKALSSIIPTNLPGWVSAGKTGAKLTALDALINVHNKQTDPNLEAYNLIRPDQLYKNVGESHFLPTMQLNTKVIEEIQDSLVFDKELEEFYNSLGIENE